MNMKQSCKALICAIEGELDGRHCTEEQAAAILDHALPSLTEALARLQSQLAEAVGLLDDIACAHKHGWSETHAKEVSSFLARHAQAEQQEAREYNAYAEPPYGRTGKYVEPPARLKQREAKVIGDRISAMLQALVPNQEAQGAQAGDEREAFERNPNFIGMDFSRATNFPDYYESPFANGAWQGWKARAALATQPAVRGAEHDQ